jgi:hypothetical protein
MRPHAVLDVADTVHVECVETDFPGHDDFSDSASGD